MSDTAYFNSMIGMDEDYVDITDISVLVPQRAMPYGVFCELKEHLPHTSQEIEKFMTQITYTQDGEIATQEMSLKLFEQCITVSAHDSERGLGNIVMDTFDIQNYSNHH